jgi:hypothetical protein
VAAGNVPGLVRQDANDLVRRARIEQRPGIHEDAPAVHHKGVKAALIDDDDAHVLLREARRLEDGRQIFTQELLDLGVADDRQFSSPHRLGAGGIGRCR